jgi:uncharacterized hydrophobic protein (TIGR00271 family)
MTIVLDAPDLHSRVRAAIDTNSRTDAAYLTMNALATLIACYGLLENSPAVVIGAMLIALLLDPISGLALGLVDGNDALVRKASLSVLAGAGVVYGTGFAFGALHTAFPLTAEIYARTAPNLMDLMIALFGGAAGAYAMTSARLNGALVGVAISTALVPPLASSAICLARAEYRLSGGAFLLTLANIIGIQTASSLVMWLRGYRGQRAAQVGSGRLLKRSAVSVAMLVALAVLLTVNLRRLIRNEVYEASVRSVLQREASAHPGAYLVDTRFRREPGHLVITAIYRTPIPFAPAQVAVIEDALPSVDTRTTLELRIRSIPVTVASGRGYLYSDDLPEAASLR